MRTLGTLILISLGAAVILICAGLILFAQAIEHFSGRLPRPEGGPVV